MNLLGAKLYDPSSAVSKATSSLLAMTAFDTTNLRVAVTVPAHGMIYVRVMGGAVTGATTVPTLFLGVMNGSTILARLTPQDFPGTMNAATQSCPLYAECVITGLTPGAMNLDLAYGVEVVVASTNIKYGGPNDTTTNNAWGGISFQVWDPQPMTANSTLAVDSNGRVDVIKVAGTTQTARDLGASVLLSSGTGTGQLDFTSGVVKANLAQILGTALTETAGQIAAAFKKFFDIASPTSTMNTITTVTTTTTATTATNLTNLPSIPANWLTAAGINAAALNGKGDWNIGKTGYALSAAGVQAIWDALTSALTTVGSIGKWIVDKLDVIVSTRLAASGYTAPLDAAGTRSALGLATANLDTQLAAIASYIDTEVATILAAQGTLTAAERNSIADAVLGRNVAGGSSAGRLVKDALAFLRNKWTLVDTTLTVYDTDDSTTLWTATIVRTAGDPVSSSDPA